VSHTSDDLIEETFPINFTQLLLGMLSITITSALTGQPEKTGLKLVTLTNCYDQSS
jgi:hypothetical protein